VVALLQRLESLSELLVLLSSRLNLFNELGLLTDQNGELVGDLRVALIKTRAALVIQRLRPLKTPQFLRDIANR